MADTPDVLKKFAKKLKARAKMLRATAERARTDPESPGYRIDYWRARATEAETIAAWAIEGGGL